MKRTLLVFVLGLILGGASVWLALRIPLEHSTETNPATEAALGDGLRLSQERQTLAGIFVAKPEAAELQSETKAYGRVLDASGLAASLAELSSAQAALSGSTKEFARQKTLGEDGAARTLEAAEAALGRDRAALELVRARLWAAWGAALCSRGDLAQLSHDLLEQKASLVRVDFTAGETRGTTATNLTITTVTIGNSWEAELIGPAPNADPLAQGLAFLALIRGTGPVPGTSVLARLRGAEPAQSGFTLPRAAVIQHEGRSWVFVREAGEKFVRKPVEVWSWQSDAVLLRAGVALEAEIVVSGAQQLLSEELKATSGPE